MTVRDVTRLTSFLLRVLWAGWQIGARRQRTIDDVKRCRAAMLDAAKDYLPEFTRLTKGQKSNGHKNQNSQ
jgi:hypothetical protein